MKLFKKNQSSSLFSFERSAIDYESQTEAESDHIKDALLPSGGDEAVELDQSSPTKLFIVGAFLLVVFFALFGAKLFELQVVHGQRYEELANGNRIRERITYAPRGRILDRNGKVLAENTLTFQVTVTPYLLSGDADEQLGDFKQVAKILDQPLSNLRKTSLEEGLEHPLPILLAEQVSHQTALKLEQFLPDLPGFSLDEIPTRVYAAEAGLAHILGYVGRVSEAELSDDKTELLLPVDFIGKNGVEAQYDSILRGVNGQERSEVDALGRPVRLLGQNNSVHGQDIYLTIDYDLQVRFEKEIRKQMVASGNDKASGVAIDPISGEVLAMVSIPFFDNNLFAGGISQANFDKLQNNPNQPLLNRAIQAGYSSGSTIKPVVASAALQEKVVTPQTIIVDTGAISVTSQYQPGAAFVFRGWRPGGLGPMDVRRAIAWSSNIYFYTVGGGHGPIEGLGQPRLANYYRDFGLGSRSGIDLPSEFSGFVPDEAWKLETRGEDWFVGDSYNISIGQGDLLVTPLQLTLANAVVANQGTLIQPHILYKVGDEVIEHDPARHKVAVDKSNLKIVREGMRQVLTDGTTCECRFSGVPVEVAGKSGTAQTTSDDSRPPHAWYTAYAPWTAPEIHATVIIEHGSGGSTYSAPAIAGLFEEYFNRR